MVPLKTAQVSEKFTKLGSKVDALYRRCNYNQADLPAIAADALTEFESDLCFDALTIAEFLSETNIAQQPRLRFSDLPITVFRNREFYIEVLIWTHSTTSVHQHSFSGAFKVLQGSSIHTTFSFQPRQTMSPDLILGEVTAEQTEYLHRGAVRQIVPRSEGLIHSLYHLDQPSLTIVVRTSGHEHYQPQYSYHRPYLCFNQLRLEQDELVVMYLKLLGMAHQLTPEVIPKLWIERIARLDFARLAYLYLQGEGYFQTASDRETFLSQARLIQGDWINYLEASVQFRDRLSRISQSRQVLSNPDLRYFLALLMNAKDRNDLFEMVKVRYPDRNPLECCAEWLTQLSKGKADTALRLTQVVQQSKVGALRLGQKLGTALPDGIDDKTAQGIFLYLMQDHGCEQRQASLQAMLSDTDPTMLDRVKNRLATVEELTCLWST